MTNLEITNAYVGNTQAAKIYLGTDVVWEKEEEPEAQLFYNGAPITGTQENPTTITLNTSDTSIAFDVVTKDQNTPWVICHGLSDETRGTGSTQNVSVQALPNNIYWLQEAQTLVYKKDGDQDDAYVDWMGWTGVASVIRYAAN